MEILMALSRIFDAEKFAPIVSAHISGVSYKNLSDEGLEFIESMAQDRKVVVPATLNPAGMDLAAWRSMGISEEFARKQERIIAAFVRMGLDASCTCTPYLTGNTPRRGDILAWGESSAVTYVNSIIGARSNREGGPAALAAAFIGETPLRGLLLDENRKPQVTVKLKATLRSESDYGAMGMALARSAPGKIPLIVSNFEPSTGGLRALSAALPTYGGASLFHWSEITPEWQEWSSPGEQIRIGTEEIAAAYKRWEKTMATADLVFIGCPHLGYEEIAAIATRLRGRRTSTPLWLSTSRAVATAADMDGLLNPIRDAGGRVVCDTCPVVAPLPPTIRHVVTDSAKGCYYLEGAGGIEVTMAPRETCLELALKRVTK